MPPGTRSYMLKSACTTELDSEPATYVPHLLCKTCHEADTPSLIRQEGFKLDELDEAIKRAQKLEWDVDKISRNAARCRFCTLLLRCLTNIKGAKSSLGDHVKVFVELQPIGDYYDWGELTLWAMLMRRNSVPSRESFYMCQLNVGIRENVPQELPHPQSSQSLSGDTAPSGSPSALFVAEQKTSLAQQSMDVPLRRQDKTGFLLPGTTGIPRPIFDRRLNHVPPLFETKKWLSTGFDSMHETVASWAMPTHFSQEPVYGSSSTGPPLNVSSMVEIKESMSDFCIRLEGNDATGPLNRVSWKYEINNIMKSRSIDARRANLAQAARWIRHCHLWHAPDCRHISWGGPNSGTLAFRVIDIKTLCIVAAPARCQYAALSYRWGDAEQHKLQKETYENMHKSGALTCASAKLPNTIRDAMLVCDGISIRYLWVDALCIVQDEAEDRDAQVASMDFIYGGAYLTIVAAFGDSADAGLPGISIPRCDRHIPITIKGISLNTQPRSAAKRLLDSQWYTRGWTFQELVLSKRILAFTQEQMLFFCMKGTFREDMVLETNNGMLRLISDGEDGLFDKHLALNGDLLFGEQNHNQGMAPRSSYGGILANFCVDEAFKGYQEFLTAYLRRQLSDPYDILNGFAGILDGLSAHLGSFRWGLPTSGRFTADALTWNSKESFPLIRRQGFPSWSWAGWEKVGDLEFHPTRSATLILEYTPDVLGAMPLFYVFQNSGMALRLDTLHQLDASESWSNLFSETWLQDIWPLLQPTYTQYLIVIAQTALLTVEGEPIHGDSSANPNGDCAYAIRSGFISTSAHIHLNPKWRSKQPNDMEFLMVRNSFLGVSLMLIKRSGAVAHRIQMVNKPVDGLFWRMANPRRVLTILG